MILVLTLIQKVNKFTLEKFTIKNHIDTSLFIDLLGVLAGSGNSILPIYVSLDTSSNCTLP